MNYSKQYFTDQGRIGGTKGGKAKGERKRRDKDHYKRIARMGVEARQRKRELEAGE